MEGDKRLTKRLKENKKDGQRKPKIERRCHPSIERQTHTKWGGLYEEAVRTTAGKGDQHQEGLSGTQPRSPTIWEHTQTKPRNQRLAKPT